MTNIDDHKLRETALIFYKDDVDAISVGALTHSAPAIDLSLEVEVL